MNIGTLTIEMAANVARLSKDMDAARRTVERTFGSIEKDVARLKDLLGNLFAGLSVAAFVGKLVDVQRQFDVLNSSLITVTGSSAAAAREFAWIKQFAATTPFQLAEVTSAFVKMKALGLDASQAALTSYGNTASAMGKSLNQMIEAVADAATGEFERLKEFGIKAKQQGDQVTLTFQGVSKTIGNNAAEITAYLQAIGNNEFAGAMAQRAQTLDGAISNLADTWDELFRTINSQQAGGLIYDSVKLASGAIEDLTTILNALNGATAENAKQTGAMKVIQEGIAIVFETVTVLGVTVAYVIKQIGTELGGLAAQAAAVARLDFSSAREIGGLMREDAEAARREVDALSERILNARRQAEQARQSLQGVDTRAEDARLARYAQAGSRALSTVTTAAATAKKGVDEFAKSVERGVQLYGSLTAQGNGLAANFAEQWQDLANAYKASKINLEQLVAAQAQLLEQQPFAKELAKEQAEALKKQEEAAKALAKAELERIEALERSAESAEGQLQRLLDEEKALAIAAEKNITLAQALEEVAIARLREQQAALMREGDRDAEVLAIQREIDARKKLAEAIGRKEARDAAAESAREAEREWRRTAEGIERSLTDALLRGFESGKDFARNLRDTLVNMFNTLVLRPVIQAIVAPVAGVITGALGLPSNAMASNGLGSSLGLANGLKSVYDTIMGGFSSLGNSVAFAAQDIGAWLVNNTTGVLNKLGGSLMSNAGALGTAASYLGGIGAGIGLGKLISGGYSAIGKSGNTANVIGTGVGAVLGGPVGAAIGGAVGGLVNRAFGRKLKDYGIEGTFGGDGFEGHSYQFYKGGWFRSDKTKRGPLDPGLDKALDQQFMAIKTTVLGLGEVLGVARTALDGFRQSIKLSFKGLNEQQIQEKLNEVFNGLGESMARSILGASADAFIKEGETAQQALVRLASSLQAVNGAIELLGGNLLEASLASGDLASKIVEAFGGLDQFGSAVQTYYANFYTEQERQAKAVESMEKAFADLGLTMPKTKAEFRALVEAQDLTTEAGRKTYAALLQLSGAFADVADAAEAARKAAEAAAEQARQARVSALHSATDRAMEGLRRAIDTENRRLGIALDVAAKSVSRFSDLLGVIQSGIRSLYSGVEEIAAAEAARGRAFIAEALTAAQTAGYLPDSEELSRAINDVVNSPEVYASRVDELRARVQTADQLNRLGKLTGSQLTTAERQLQAIEKQIEQNNELLDSMQSQIDIMRGVYVETGSISDALDKLVAAIVKERAETTPTTGGATGSTGGAKGSTGGAVIGPGSGVVGPGDGVGLSVVFNEQQFGSATLRGLGDYTTGRYIYTAKTAAGQVSLETTSLYTPPNYLNKNPDVLDYYNRNKEELRRLGIDDLYEWANYHFANYGIAEGRAFAKGGYYPGGLALVGEEGPEIINFENPGQVYTAAQTRSLFDNREMVAELKALRAEVIELRVQSRRTADAVNGNPEAPMLVETVA